MKTLQKFQKSQEDLFHYARFVQSVTLPAHMEQSEHSRLIRLGTLSNVRLVDTNGKKNFTEESVDKKVVVG